MSDRELDRASGQIYFVTGTLTTTAAALGASSAALSELVIQADPDNAVDILIGSSATQAWKLEPGDQFACPVRNPALIYGKTGSSTATYSLFGRFGE